MKVLMKSILVLMIILSFGLVWAEPVSIDTTYYSKDLGSFTLVINNKAVYFKGNVGNDEVIYGGLGIPESSSLYDDYDVQRVFEHVAKIRINNAIDDEINKNELTNAYYEERDSVYRYTLVYSSEKGTLTVWLNVDKETGFIWYEYEFNPSGTIEVQGIDIYVSSGKFSSAFVTITDYDNAITKTDDSSFLKMYKVDYSKLAENVYTKENDELENEDINGNRIFGITYWASLYPYRFAVMKGTLFTYTYFENVGSFVNMKFNPVKVDFTYSDNFYGVTIKSELNTKVLNVEKVRGNFVLVVGENEPLPYAYYLERYVTRNPEQLAYKYGKIIKMETEFGKATYLPYSLATYGSKYFYKYISAPHGLYKYDLFISKVSFEKLLDYINDKGLVVNRVYEPDYLNSDSIPDNPNTKGYPFDHYQMFDLGEIGIQSTSVYCKSSGGLKDLTKKISDEVYNLLFSMYSCASNSISGECGLIKKSDYGSNSYWLLHSCKKDYLEGTTIFDGDLISEYTWLGGIGYDSIYQSNEWKTTGEYSLKWEVSEDNNSISSFWYDLGNVFSLDNRKFVRIDLKINDISQLSIAPIRISLINDDTTVAFIHLTKDYIMENIQGNEIHLLWRIDKNLGVIENMNNVVLFRNESISSFDRISFTYYKYYLGDSQYAGNVIYIDNIYLTSNILQRSYVLNTNLLGLSYLEMREKCGLSVYNDLKYDIEKTINDIPNFQLSDGFYPYRKWFNETRFNGEITTDKIEIVDGKEHDFTRYHTYTLYYMILANELKRNLFNSEIINSLTKAGKFIEENLETYPRLCLSHLCYLAPIYREDLNFIVSNLNDKFEYLTLKAYPYGEYIFNHRVLFSFAPDFVYLIGLNRLIEEQTYYNDNIQVLNRIFAEVYGKDKRTGLPFTLTINPRNTLISEYKLEKIIGLIGSPYRDLIINVNGNNVQYSFKITNADDDKKYLVWDLVASKDDTHSLITRSDDYIKDIKFDNNADFQIIEIMFKEIHEITKIKIKANGMEKELVVKSDMDRYLVFGDYDISLTPEITGNHLSSIKIQTMANTPVHYFEIEFISEYMQDVEEKVKIQDKILEECGVTPQDSCQGEISEEQKMCVLNIINEIEDETLKDYLLDLYCLSEVEDNKKEKDEEYVEPTPYKKGSFAYYLNELLEYLGFNDFASKMILGLIILVIATYYAGKYNATVGIVVAVVSTLINIYLGFFPTWIGVVMMFVIVLILALLGATRLSGGKE